MSETGTPPVRDLDPAHVGTILINAVAAAAALGHKRLSSTLRDYVDPETPEGRFVQEAITRPVSEVADEWFGGYQNACHWAQDAAFGDR